MIRVTTFVFAAVIAIPAAAQQPVQFKANVKTKNGNDGTTATGTMYFGGQAQGVFSISADLKTYDLMTAVGAVDIKETTETRIDGKSCSDGHTYTKNET